LYLLLNQFLLLKYNVYLVCSDWELVITCENYLLGR